MAIKVKAIVKFKKLVESKVVFTKQKIILNEYSEIKDLDVAKLKEEELQVVRDNEIVLIYKII